MRPYRWLVGFVLGASGCVLESSSSNDPGNEFANRPKASVNWRSCGDLQCGEVAVPIDYAAPALGTIDIAVNRAPTYYGTGTYRGAVLVNPGGPGAPGKSFVAAMAGPLRAEFPG